MLGQLRAPAPPVSAEIRVCGRYDPDVIRITTDAAGRQVQLGFLRQERAACSERLVFPGLGLNFALPAYEPVVVDLGWLVPGEYDFTCQMGVLRGRLILEEPEGSRR